MSDSGAHTYQDWAKFKGDKIPSSLAIDPFLYSKIRRGEPIIDIGCGFGRTSFEILENGYGTIVGCDINENGIRYANEVLSNLDEQSRTRCRFEIMDALRTEFHNGAFTFGIMQAFLTTLSVPEHRKLALAEARRVIKPDGGLYIADFIQTWHQERYRSRYEKDYKETGELGTFNAYDPDTGALLYRAHHYTEQELVRLLLDAHFQVEHLEYRVFTTRTGNEINGVVIWAI